jgi:hypothetical protein
MGGRGASGLDLSYQGRNYGSGKATSNGINALQMKQNLQKVNSLAIESPLVSEALQQIERISSKTDRIKIYRATVGDSINTGDWIFLSRAQAENWTKTAFGTPKPGVKVIEATAKAENVDWTGKNLEFVYKGKHRIKNDVEF